MKQTSKNRRRILWKQLLRLLVTALLLAFVFSRFPLSNVLDALAQTRVQFFIFAALASFVAAGAQGLQLRQALLYLGERLPLWRVIRIQVIATFYTVILPSELTASVIKWMRLSKGSLGRSASAAVIFYCRILNSAGLVAVALPGILLDRQMNLPAVRIAIVALAFCVAVVLLPMTFPGAAKIIEPFVRRLSGMLPAPPKAKEAAEKFWRASIALGEIGASEKAILFVLAVIPKLLGPLSFWMLCRAVGFEFSYWAILWLNLVLFILSALPISIAGLGVREATLVSILPQLYGVQPAQALAASLLVMGVNLLFLIVGGSFETMDAISGHSPSSGEAG